MVTMGEALFGRLIGSAAPARVPRPGRYVFPLRAADGNQGCTIYCTVDANGKIDCTMHWPSGQTIAGSPRMAT